MAYTTKCENSVIASICSTHAVMKNLTLFREVKQTVKHAPSLKLTKCIKHSWRKEYNREEKSNVQALHFHHMNHCTLFRNADPTDLRSVGFFILVQSCFQYYITLQSSALLPLCKVKYLQIVCFSFWIKELMKQIQIIYVLCFILLKRKYRALISIEGRGGVKS